MRSFTIVTQPAGAPLNTYHDCTPLALERSAESVCLDLDADATPLAGRKSVDGLAIELAA